MSAAIASASPKVPPTKPPRPPGFPRAAEPDESTPEPERLIPINETRSRLGGIARSALYRLLAQRRLKSVKLGRRRMILESSVDQLIARLARGA